MEKERKRLGFSEPEYLDYLKRKNEALRRRVGW